jgi:hypothetical protein
MNAWGAKERKGKGERKERKQERTAQGRERKEEELRQL